MKRNGRTWWLIFGGCVAVVIAAMIGVTVLVLDLERQHRRAAADSAHQDTLHLALWRMDSWLGPRLAREAARPYFEYYAWYAPEMIYTRLLNEIRAGDVLSPSPLLAFESEFIPIHFQIEPDGAITSPQVPTGNQLDLAEAALLPAGRVAQKAQLLDEVRGFLADRDIALMCTEGEWRTAARFANTNPANIRGQLIEGAQQAAQQQEDMPWRSEPADRKAAELQKRAQTTYQTQQVLETPVVRNAADELNVSGGAMVDAGPLVPVWIDCTSEVAPGSALAAFADDHLLVFLRKIGAGKQQVYQGFIANWPAIRSSLAAQASDLLPDLSITPPAESSSGNESAWMLTTIPAWITTPAPALQPASLTARLTLALMWIGVLIAIAAAGLTLRSSIDFANRRNRFASAVTHELRTPLTTFQMYSEMLAEGIVSDPARRKLYYETLRDESTRLNALVENVLAYSRIEDGRAQIRTERLPPRTLLEQMLPALERRAEKSGAALDLRIEGELPNASFEFDTETIGRIVFNLVDNACKYACNGAGSRIEFSARADRDRLILSVRDHGPGVPARLAGRIFEPFDRGALEPGSAAPGVGLGLALARELAITLGGSLRLTPLRDGPGACFTLDIPLRTNPHRATSSPKSG